MSHKQVVAEITQNYHIIGGCTHPSRVISLADFKRGVFERDVPGGRHELELARDDRDNPSTVTHHSCFICHFTFFFY